MENPGFSPSGISRKISDRSVQFGTTTEVPPSDIYIYIYINIYISVLRIKYNLKMVYIFVMGFATVTAVITEKHSINKIIWWV